MKKLILILLVSCILLFAGCDLPESKWVFIDDGNLTGIDEIQGETALTFDNVRVHLLGGWPLENNHIVLNRHYYLYKENSGAIWNGYHLTEHKIGDNDETK